jgi:hypothetical protein
MKTSNFSEVGVPKSVHLVIGNKIHKDLSRLSLIMCPVDATFRVRMIRRKMLWIDYSGTG